MEFFLGAGAVWCGMTALENDQSSLTRILSCVISVVCIASLVLLRLVGAK